MIPVPDADTLIKDLLPAVMEAARAELGHFAAGVEVLEKPDASPVTAADHEAEAILLEALASCAPRVPVIAEEQAAAGLLPQAGKRFFLVDALDGTRYFIRGKPEFSINVALVEGGAPVFGLIYVPPTGRLYVTRSDGRSYTAIAPSSEARSARAPEIGWTQMRTRAADRRKLVAYHSRSTAGGASAEFLKALGVSEARSLGSSEKFCLLAEGQGDVYARLGPTYEWDTAAGQAILEAAGGCVTTTDGARLTYGKAEGGYLNPGFIAWGGAPLLTDFLPPPGARTAGTTAKPASGP